MNRKSLSRMAVVLLVFAMLLPAALPASAESITGNFEAFTLGSVNGQGGWSMTGPYDVAVVTNTYGYTSFGTQSLRISNAVTSGAFGDQTFSKQLANEAGETTAYAAAPAGTRQKSFVAQWNFASTVPGAEQPGLSITASPDWGDGSRMSWVQMADTPSGLEVNFYDYQDVAPYGSLANPENGRGPEDDFVFTNLASGLARSVPHQIRMEMDLLDGPHNDVVRLYVDGLLKHTGTSWEDYFRWMQGPGDPEQTAPVHESRTIRAMLFRAGGTAAPATLGNGFVIDNLSTTSATPVPMASTNDLNRTKGWAHVDQTAISAVSTTLAFIQPRAFYACFEYRTDGDTSQRIGATNYNAAITDGLYPFECLNPSASQVPMTLPKTLTAREYVEVRHVFGGESDERFDWTRFNLLPPSLSASTTDALVCGDTAVVTIDLAGVENLYGYQFEVSYDATKASAVGAFDYSFFDANGSGAVPGGTIPPNDPWNAKCAAGVCSFARTELSPDLAVSGSGMLAEITLTGIAPGAFNMAISGDVLTDIDGFAITHNLGAPLPITVCGFATASGKISLQGRATPGGTVLETPWNGKVTLRDTTNTFVPVSVDTVFLQADGTWSISGLPVMPGGTLYELKANTDLYLPNAKTMTLMPGIAYPNQNTKLWGGDATNNETVDIGDLGCIGGSFGTTPPGTCAGGSADINADGVINIQDLSITGGNYTKTGAQTW